MNLNLVVPTVANLKIEWFHFTKSQKFSGSIVPFSKSSGSTEPLEPPLTPALTGMNALFWLIFVPLIGFSSQIFHSNLKYDDDLQDFKWQVFRKMIIETVLFRMISPLFFIYINENFRSFAACTIHEWIYCT